MGQGLTSFVALAEDSGSVSSTEIVPQPSIITFISNLICSCRLYGHQAMERIHSYKYIHASKTLKHKK